MLQEAQGGQLQAVKKKFSLPKFCEVSKIRLEHSSSSQHPSSHHLHQKNSKSQALGNGGVVNTVQGNLSQHENSSSSQKQKNSNEKQSTDDGDSKHTNSVDE